ncbi:DNA polymerase III subunit gamma/tau [Marivibrio halodurans]|uniref:DNA polymerase III subunit gamma/tau n=2 Tax=Marivibrio halodurans TaxID=2039722 RepID=A0A8J7SLL4_9PROT|nr:DNA polymerase III subunit gamma/tau [Marivibrio halodurans]
MDRDDETGEDGAPEAPPPGPNLFGEETPPPEPEASEPEPPESDSAPAEGEGAPVNASVNAPVNSPPDSPAEATSAEHPAEPPMGEAAGKKSDAYRVLARKYRPTNFEELIGQEPLVRTLTNAINANRIAQAFVLTGVRGVGKTTTARIIAKALNCTGPDGTGGPTTSPCGRCENCLAIASDRHVDVIEMDAASRTGVNDIRDLIDGVRYRPTSARYKVYILDEVHMLSNQAFNALLKTLEEPPAHVKFVFATTEIRKVPVTVLSRCQRFDLRRVPVEQLSGHFRRVAEAEGMGVEDEALAMIARAADGSVRDGLSILDQAIALSSGTVEGARVRDMLGLADRARIYDLYDAVMKGDAAGALDVLGGLYDVGADPAVVIQDMLDITHWLTRAKIVPGLFDQSTTPELERTRGREMAERLSMPILSRAWQMLMKGLGEVREAPSPIQAAEMVLIRLIHAADMPPPGDLIKQLRGADGGAASTTGGAATGGAAPSGGGAPPASGAGPNAVSQAAAPGAAAPQQAPTAQARTTRLPTAQAEQGGARTALQSAPQPVETEAPAPNSAPALSPALSNDPIPQDFRALVALAEKRKELRIASALRRHVHPVALERGRLEFRLSDSAPRDLKELPGQLTRKLTDWTGERWIVSLSNAPGAPTIVEQEKANERARLSRAEGDPLVQAIKSAFPGAEIVRVTGRDTGGGPEVSSTGEESGDSGTGLDPDPTATPFPDPGPEDDEPPPWEDGDPGPFDP